MKTTIQDFWKITKFQFKNLAKFTNRTTTTSSPIENLSNMGQNFIALIYSNPTQLKYDEVLDAKRGTHTMNSVWREYLEKKTPPKFWEEIKDENTTVEVHSVHAGHFEKHKELFGISHFEFIPFTSTRPGKKYNTIRPKFYKCWDKYNRKKIVVCVTPGYDYWLNSCTNIKSYLCDYFGNEFVKPKLSFFHYPEAENSLFYWSNLDSNFIKKNDIVLIGYVSELEEKIFKNNFEKIGTLIENDFYGSVRYKTPNGIVNLLGVKYSFWGNTSARLSKKICELGASELIYVGKLGTLTSPQEIYTKIYCPIKYSVMWGENHIIDLESIPNPYYEFNSKNENILFDHHFSVPTMGEESFTQRQLIEKRLGKTIDNEISQIAFAIEPFKIPYFSLHFATDYLFKQSESEDTNVQNLVKAMQEEAKMKKEKMLNEISPLLYQYLIRLSNSTKKPCLSENRKMMKKARLKKKNAVVILNDI
jgi:hypothetical protein